MVVLPDVHSLVVFDVLNDVVLGEYEIANDVIDLRQAFDSKQIDVLSQYLLFLLRCAHYVPDVVVSQFQDLAAEIRIVLDAIVPRFLFEDKVNA